MHVLSGVTCRKKATNHPMSCKRCFNNKTKTSLHCTTLHMCSSLGLFAGPYFFDYKRFRFKSVNIKTKHDPMLKLTAIRRAYLRIRWHMPSNAASLLLGTILNIRFWCKPYCSSKDYNERRMPDKGTTLASCRHTMVGGSIAQHYFGHIFRTYFVLYSIISDIHKAWPHVEIDRNKARLSKNSLTHAQHLCCSVPSRIHDLSKDYNERSIPHKSWRFHCTALFQSGNALYTLMTSKDRPRNN